MKTGGTFWKTILATALFALLHSGLASRQAKELAAQKFGRRERNAFYRPFYIAQSLLSFGALALYVSHLPNKVLYRVKGPAAGLMRLGQLAGVALAGAGAIAVGLPGISGLRGLLAYLGGQAEVPAEPEAQGPSLDEDGTLQVVGPFTRSRHPLNFSPLPVFWLNPVMTIRILAFNLVATAYLVLGSIHEEERLEAAYGEVYRRYQESETPFYVPAGL